ncbi:MAG: hypothetical protein ABSF81_16575 [Bacteroidales bacterium]
MSRNLNFYGNVSLVAKINNDPIKVGPYSKVGEKQGKIGISSASPSELSSYLISLICEMKNLQESIDDLLKSSEDTIINNTKLLAIDTVINYLHTMPKYNLVYDYRVPHNIKTINENLIKDYASLSGLLNRGDFIVSDMLMEYEKIKADITNKYIENVNAKNLIRLVEYEEMSLNLDMAMSYLSFFQSGNTEVKGFYLRFTKQDKLELDSFLGKLKSCASDFHKFNDITLDVFRKIRKKSAIELYLLSPSIENFNSNADAFLKSLNYDPKNFVKSYPETLKNETVLTALAKKIGYQVYQKLLTGNIDLNESRAKEGDVLKISVLWYQDSDSTSAPLELDLASFDIKETGWRLKVSDSFLLVNRISKPKDISNLSPSLFKGAPGVSLLYTYGNNSSKNFIFKRIEPSLGINVSYLDFDTSKDLEVGIGFVLGLLRNNVFITFGYNLNAKTDGLYYGLGFSFANIASRINNKTQ